MMGSSFFACAKDHVKHLVEDIETQSRVLVAMFTNQPPIKKI